MPEAKPASVAVIDYGMGNLRSVAKIVSRTGAPIKVTSDPVDIRAADRLILPGVGAFPDAMQNLRAAGLIDVLNEEVVGKRKPILGICLGMELLAKSSEEVRPTSGLGWIDADMVMFERNQGIRVPHVGWNTLKIRRNGCSLLDRVDDGSTFYFVHSYYMRANDPDLVVATANYGHEFCAMVQKGNIYGTQFHPEKSQANGFLMLINFVNANLN
jgi:glutamine amidotransferase